MSTILQRGAGVLTVAGGPSVFATLSPTVKSPAIALSNGDLTAQATDSTWKNVQATIGKTTGKWYWEFKVDATSAALSNGTLMMGCANESQVTSSYPGSSVNSLGWQSYQERKFFNGGLFAGFWSFYHTATGLWHFVIIDADNRTMAAGKVGESVVYAPDIIAGSGPIFPAVGLLTSGNTVTCNFGATPFNGTVPVGVNAGVFK